MAGVEAARRIITRTRESGVNVRDSLDAVLAEMNPISATLPPAKGTK